MRSLASAIFGSTRRNSILLAVALSVGAWVALDTFVDGQTTGAIGPVTRVRFGSNSGPFITSGTGAPESAVTAPVGSIFLRTNGGAGTTACIKESGSGNTGWVCANTVTEVRYLPTAACDQSAGYAPLFYSAGSNFPQYLCSFGSNSPVAGLTYEDSTEEYVWQEFALPSDWTGAIDLTLFWRTAATSGNVRFYVRTACVAVGESLDPAWATTQALTDAAQGTTLRLNTVSLSSVDVSTCAAGELFKYMIGRDPANGSDTLGADADLLGVQWTYRRVI